MSKVIPIKKHTPIRRPMSKYRIGLGTYATYTETPNPVQDIVRVWKPHETWAANPNYKYSGNELPIKKVTFFSNIIHHIKKRRK